MANQFDSATNTSSPPSSPSSLASSIHSSSNALPLTVSPLVPLVSSCSARKFSTTSSTDEDMDDKFLSDSSGTSVESSVFVKDQVGDASAASAAAAAAATTTTATATEAAAVLHVSPVSTDGFLSSLEHLLSLRQVDPHTFTNCSELFVPYRGRGLFGGTLAAQATLAALLFTNTEDKKWKPISLHCHFLYAATPSPALFYKVHSLKDGKNYCTRSVDLYQDDRLIFRATCSLQAYELAGSAAKLDGQLSHYRQGPEVGKDIEPPEEMFSQEEAFFAWSRKAYKHRHLGYLKTALEDVTASYAREPCVWRLPLGMFDLEHVSEAEREMVPSDRTLRYWVKTKEALKDPHVFSWVALAYISDYFFLSTNMRLNMREMFTTKFSVSLDHTIYFDKEIDVSEWFNYNVKSLKSGENRTIMTGEMFSREGELLASTYQEGLSVVFTD